MTSPEQICPCCGCGMESGWPYPSCADFPVEEQPDAHAKFCRGFALDVCSECLEAIS